MRPAGGPPGTRARCGHEHPASVDLQDRRALQPRTVQRADRRYAGIIVSDRWPGYEHLQPERRQVCWSHLQRDFRRHAEGLAEQKTFGEAGLELTGRVFGAWRDFQEHQDRRRLRRELKPTQRELRRLLERAGRNSKRTRFHRVFANNLLKIWPALWTFATHPDVEPTNNPAERALRTPVIHRKLSHGTRTKQGEQFAERALSAAATCRQQHRSLFEFLSKLLDRPPPRRPTPHAHLTPGLNGYGGQCHDKLVRSPLTFGHHKAAS